MTIPTNSIDETKPAGTRGIKLGDDDIREFKTQNREVLEVDHEYPSSGQSATAGQHKQVTLQEQADLGTGAVSATILGSQTVSGKGELVYTDEDDNDVQITSGGVINPAAITSISTTALGTIYPIGCIYTEITGTNPNTTFGFGTWTAFGAGRVMVGYDSGDTDFDSAEETGGSKTFDNAHTHTIDRAQSRVTGRPTGDIAATLAGTYSEGLGTSTISTNSTGSATQSVVQPYITVHFWKRTA